MIVQEIERLSGLSTAPREDQRHRTIERLENALRDLIHNALGVRFGQDYWKHAVPEDVRTEVEKRIEATLRKQPKLKLGDFDLPREKLSFCTFGDYAKIIQVKSNWPEFEDVFRRRADFERHIEVSFEFRNALMHNRPLLEYGRRAGELAVISFDAVLAKEPPPETDDEALPKDAAASVT